MRFGDFVDRLDVALRSIVAPPVSLAREETPGTAVWIRPPFRVGVTRTADGVLAWIGVRGVAGRMWDEPRDEAAVERLAVGFAAVLCAPVDEPALDDRGD